MAVFPVWKNKFKIGASKTDAKVVADMETFDVSFDGNVEEWTPMDTEGWVRRMKTGMGLTIGFTGKMNSTDTGCEYVAAKKDAIGADAEAVLVWEFPDGGSAEIPCIVNVTNVGGGDSINVGPLEWEAQSNGKPTFTSAAG